MTGTDSQPKAVKKRLNHPPMAANRFFYNDIDLYCCRSQFVNKLLKHSGKTKN